MSIPEPQKKSSMNCLKVGLMGCGVAAILLVVALFGFGYYVARNPSVRQFGLCTRNLTELNAALQRYEGRNGKYPDNLNELVPMFVSDRSLLHCPADPSDASNISYTFTKPAAGAPPTTVVLECTRHKLMGKPIPLRLQKNGQVEGSDKGMRSEKGY